MNHKIKILLLAMAVIASFSMWQIWSQFHVPAPADVSASIQETLATTIIDNDHDGLADIDESIWNTDFQKSDTDGDGFLDGEEVASGHDPLKPGPDDVLFGPQNITERAGNLIVSGLAEGSLKPTDKKYGESLNLVVDDLVQQYAINTMVKPSILKVVENTDENKKRYGREFGTIAPQYIQQIADDFIQFVDILAAGDVDLSDLSAALTDPRTKTAVISFLAPEDTKLQEKIRTLELMDVPAAFEQNHQKFLTVLKNLQKNYGAFLQADRDPMFATMALDTLLNTFTKELPDYALELLKK